MTVIISFKHILKKTKQNNVCTHLAFKIKTLMGFHLLENVTDALVRLFLITIVQYDQGTKPIVNGKMPNSLKESLCNTGHKLIFEKRTKNKTLV